MSASYASTAIVPVGQAEKKSVSYAELNRRASRLAWRLREECGVGAERCVGLSAKRSVGLLVGVLGILKAGAAYLPMDVAYPPDLVDMVLADAKPKGQVILGKGSLVISKL